MKNQTHNHLTVTLGKLEKEGYTDQINFADNKFENLTSKNKYSDKEIKSYKEFRFEGMSDPSDLSILFAIEFVDGSKGTLVAIYGPNADVNLFEQLTAINDKKEEPI